MLPDFWKICELLGTTAVLNTRADVYQMFEPADLQKLCGFFQDMEVQLHYVVITSQSVRVQSQCGRQKNPTKQTN